MTHSQVAEWLKLTVLKLATFRTLREATPTVNPKHTSWHKRRLMNRSRSTSLPWPSVHRQNLCPRASTSADSSATGQSPDSLVHWTITSQDLHLLKTINGTKGPLWFRVLELKLSKMPRKRKKFKKECRTFASWGSSWDKLLKSYRSGAQISPIPDIFWLQLFFSRA